jgi:ABC-type multidrug transport system, ATPase component
MPMPIETMIECEMLTKRFGHFTAVDHVSFSVGKGSIFGFLGPNGASPLRSHGCDSSAQNSILPELARFVCA